MATSSRPFQSQTVARLVAGYRQMAHGAGRWLRRGRTAAVWGALWGLQVALYPVYAAVQGVRLGYRRLRAASLWQGGWAPLADGQPAELVGADIPIRSLLSVIQPPTMASSMVRSGGLRLVNRYGRWLRQSQAGAVLTSGQWHRLPLRATVQGVATDLATRQLVLVTAGNDIFDGLTDDQQHQLRQAIALMVAEYARGCHQFRLNQHLQRPGLPLPQPQPALFLPLRWIPKGLRWMQTSPLAAATNLFGEAAQQRETQAIVRRRGGSPSKSGEAYSVELTRGELTRGELTSPGIFAGEPPHLYAASPSRSLAPATTSVAEAVALALASPSTVAPAETMPTAMGRRPASADLVDSGKDGAAIPGAVHAEGLPAAVVLPPPEALAASDQPLLSDPNVLEAQVTQVNYIDHPLVALLRGLDWLLYRLEIWLRRLGAWLYRHW